MNDYTKPEYKNLYKEILKDYQFRFPKFSPIPYPTLFNHHHAKQQRYQPNSTTKY